MVLFRTGVPVNNDDVKGVDNIIVLFINGNVGVSVVAKMGTVLFSISDGM